MPHGDSRRWEIDLCTTIAGAALDFMHRQTRRGTTTKRLAELQFLIGLLQDLSTTRQRPDERQGTAIKKRVRRDHKRRANAKKRADLEQARIRDDERDMDAAADYYRRGS